MNPHRPSSYPRRGDPKRPLTEEEKAVRDVLEANKAKAEEEWAKEHKYRGPSALDQDDVAWIQANEDRERLRKVEEELETLDALGAFQNDVKKKIFEIPKDTADPSPPPNRAPTSLSALSSKAAPVAPAKKPAAMTSFIKIVPQKKRASTESAATVSPQQDKKAKTVTEPDPPTTQRQSSKTTPEAENSDAGSALLGLSGYGDDDDSS
eukprot:TRINITY_DN18304_c0_g1_i1.p1 TRINITY_DN18304_c0_g1~~TRINITY_DN18304_c0_g1_i1.p1  ORF type:complete len:208 (-),score=45.27 TRINITY_DN18304_c0_g1_i1:25-648(-)